MRRALVTVFLLLGAFAAVLAACIHRGEIDLEITIPAQLAPGTKWVEVAAFPDVRCATALRMSVGGAPVEGTAARMYFDPREPTPSLGSMPTGYYSIVAQAKTDRCGIVARGCVELQLGNPGTIRIDTLPLDQPTAGCAEGFSCTLGQCTPERSGRNCSLDVVGSGPLPSSLPGKNLAVSSPVVHAVDQDFMAVYGEMDADDGNRAHVVVQPISANGGLRQFQRPDDLEQRCTRFPPSDGSGFAWRRNQGGFLLFSHAGCDATTSELNQGGLDSLNIDREGRRVGQARYTRHTVDQKLVRLGRNHAVAALEPNEAGPRWLAAYTVDGRAALSFFERQDGQDKLQPLSLTFGMTDVQAEAGVATSNTAMALFSIDAVDGQPPPPEPDAGPGEPEPEPDAGTAGLLPLRNRTDQTNEGNYQASIYLMPTAGLTPQSQLPTPLSLTSRFASVALRDRRAFVVASGDDGPGAPSLFTIDLRDDANPAEPPFYASTPVFPNNENASSAITYAHVAVHGDRAFVASQYPGEIIVSVFENVTTDPILLRAIRLSQVRASAVNAVQDGRLSIAANDKRVVVVWTTKTEVATTDPLGGYLMLACEP